MIYENLRDLKSQIEALPKDDEMPYIFSKLKTQSDIIFIESNISNNLKLIYIDNLKEISKEIPKRFRDDLEFLKIHKKLEILEIDVKLNDSDQFLKDILILTAEYGKHLAKLKHEEKTKKKNIIIPWTGGIDSTQLLIKALKETHHSIKAVRFDLLNNPGQNTKQKEVTKSAALILKEKYRDFSFEKRRGSVWTSQNEEGLTQIQLWLALLSNYMTKDTDEIWIACPLGHEYFSFRFSLLKIWHYLKNLKKDCSHVKLVFPNEEYSKKSLYAYIKQNCPEIADYCLWTCENPEVVDYNNDYEECGLCNSCVQAGEVLF